MNSSTYYSSKINEFETIKGQIYNVIKNLDERSSEILSIINYIDNLIINGKRIDDEKLDNLSISLSELRTTLEGIISECDSKINIYTYEYNNAIKRENYAEANKATVNSDYSEPIVSEVSNS